MEVEVQIQYENNTTNIKLIKKWGLDKFCNDLHDSYPVIDDLELQNNINLFLQKSADEINSKLNIGLKINGVILQAEKILTNSDCEFCKEILLKNFANLLEVLAKKSPYYRIAVSSFGHEIFPISMIRKLYGKSCPIVAGPLGAEYEFISRNSRCILQYLTDTYTISAKFAKKLLEEIDIPNVKIWVLNIHQVRIIIEKCSSLEELESIEKKLTDTFTNMCQALSRRETILKSYLEAPVWVDNVCVALVANQDALSHNGLDRDYYIDLSFEKGGKIAYLSTLNSQLNESDLQNLLHKHFNVVSTEHIICKNLTNSWDSISSISEFRKKIHEFLTELLFK